MIDMDRIREETARVGSGEYPRFVVMSDRLGLPVLSAEAAVEWHNQMLEQGVSTTIYDLREYDWDTNPANLKIHQKTNDALLSIANVNGVRQ